MKPFPLCTVLFLAHFFLFFGAVAQSQVVFFGKTSAGVSQSLEGAAFGNNSTGTFELGARYQLFSLQYGYGFNMHSLGQDAFLPYSVRTKGTMIGTTDILKINTINRAARQRTHRLLVALVDPFRKKAYGGLGLSFNQIPEHWVYDTRRLPAPSVWRIPKEKFWSYYVQLGYSFQGISFDWTASMSGEEYSSSSMLTLGYRYDLYEKQLKIKKKATHQAEEPDLEDDSAERFFSLLRTDVGYGFWQPLSQTKNGGATFFDVTVQAALYRNLFLGTSIALLSEPQGIDLNAKYSLPTSFASDTSNNTLANAKGMSVFLGYDIPIEYPQSYYFALGYGHFWVEQVEFDPNFSPLKTPYFKTLMFRTGVKAGLFSNTLSLYFPTGRVSPFLEFRMCVGLDFFRILE